MTSGIIEILIENASVQALVGQDEQGQYKVYPTKAPQKSGEADNTPYVVVSEVSLTPSLAKACPSTLDTPRYNVMVFSLSFRETELIQEACRNALDIGQGFDTDAGCHFDTIYMVDRQDLFQPAQGEESGLYVKLGIYEAMVNRTIT